MRHYWSCSKFADWIRGTVKPVSATDEGWRNWEKSAKSSYPIRFWIADDGLDYLQNFIFYIPEKFRDTKSYVKNRWIDRTNSLTASYKDIKPGSWKDVGDRFLLCMFNELVDFVEIEKAHMHVACAEKEEKTKYKTGYTPFWKRWRCAQAGLDHLDWESKLIFDEDYYTDLTNPKYGTPTPQALAAIEILELYNWWTKVRPNRPDPYDASGWTAYCDKKRKKSDSNLSMFYEKTPEEEEESKTSLDKLRIMEEDYEKEDEEMMIRLTKIRNSLWT
jgi:hypothetical protein